LAFTRNLLKCNSDLRRNHATLQRYRKVNVAVATTALPIARFLHSLAIHCESKKGDTILLSISLLNIDDFHNSFTDVLSWKFAIK